MTSITIGNNLILRSGVVYPLRVVTSDVTITSTSGPTIDHDYMIGVDSTSDSITVTLPSDASRTNGRAYYIFDVAGQAATNNITVSGNGKIISTNSDTSVTINNNYNSVTVVYNDTKDKWFIV